jgi:hypothetical protein
MLPRIALTDLEMMAHFTGTMPARDANLASQLIEESYEKE